MKIKQKTIADKVHDLLAKNSYESSNDSSEESANPRITEFDDDEYELPQAQTTEFRKRNVKLLSDQSAKYKGKIATRKELEEEENAEESYSASDFYEPSDDDDDDDNEEKDNGAMAAFGKKLSLMQNVKPKNGKAHKTREFEDNNDDDDDDDDDDDMESLNDSEAEEESEDDDDDDDDDENEEINKTEIVSETNRQTEIQKGVCVQNQLRIWERLLELRIQSQKMITKANQLPPPEVFHQVPHIEDIKKETVQNVDNLLHKLLDLQNTLKSQYTEMKSQTQKRTNTNRDNDDDDEPASKRLGIELEENFQEFREYRNNVLLKWDDRTKLMTPGSGNKRKSGQEDFDILKKITHALSSRKMLIERSQTLKPSKELMPTDANILEEENNKKWKHIYDDSEFYHQQLRELIEYKANTTSNMSEVTRQYVELQKLRQKMKKKVDTRASKGRKIRYIVHNKLVNFMAAEDTTSWTDQSKDELYKSLFAA